MQEQIKKRQVGTHIASKSLMPSCELLILLDEYGLLRVDLTGKRITGMKWIILTNNPSNFEKYIEA
jgi:hypothetical protein